MKKPCSEIQQLTMGEIAQSVHSESNLSDLLFCNNLKTKVLFACVTTAVWQMLCTTRCCELPHSFRLRASVSGGRDAVRALVRCAVLIAFLLMGRGTSAQ